MCDKLSLTMLEKKSPDIGEEISYQDVVWISCCTCQFYCFTKPVKEWTMN